MPITKQRFPRHKRALDVDVLTAARARVATLFDRFDTIHVSFSGGKDSTVCLQLALEEGRRRGRIIDVVFWDEEAVHPETVEYVERVRALEGIRFWWLCIPIRHRNACSRRSPFWYPWDPSKRDLWCRPLPEGAIQHIPGFRRGMGIPEGAPLVHADPRKYGNVACIRGLRASESLRRMTALTTRVHENWLGAVNRNVALASPIYDWTDVDVWTAPRLFGWDYNRAYDLYAAAGVTLRDQRVCPPYGEEPLANLYLYAVCWPDLWAKMIERVPGAATAARYARTELYSFGKSTKPEGMTWRDFCAYTLAFYKAEERKMIAASIVQVLKLHRSKTMRPVPEELSDPLTGVSWKFLAQMVVRGDMKGRKRGMLVDRAEKTRIKLGLTFADVT